MLDDAQAVDANCLRYRSKGVALSRVSDSLKVFTALALDFAGEGENCPAPEVELGVSTGPFLIGSGPHGKSPTAKKGEWSDRMVRRRFVVCCLA